MSSDSPAWVELRAKTPADWEVALLAEVTDFQEGPGILAKDFADSGVPLLRLRNIEGPNVRLDGCNYLEPAKVDAKWKHFALAPGDLLISTSASLGRVSVVDANSAGAIAYTGIIRFRSRSPRLHHEYLRAFLSSKSFVEQAERMATGSVIKHFGPSHLRQMAIALPPIGTQVRIAELFDALDDRITLLRETNATLEAIAQALFKSWFVDFDPVRAKRDGRAPEGMDEATAALFPDSFEDSELGEVPKGWEATSLAGLTAQSGGSIQTGPFGSQLHASDYVADGVPVVMPKDISLRRVQTDSIARVLAADVERLARHKLLPGDIVFSRRGDVERHALISETERGWLCGTGCLLVRPGKTWPSPTFLSMLLDAPQSRAWLVQHAVGATMPNLNTGILGSVPVVLPPSELLAAFEEVVSALEANRAENSERTRTLSTLRDTLLPRLISGQLRLPEVHHHLEST